MFKEKMALKIPPKKMAWLSFICQFKFKVHETKSRTHLDLYLTPPPPIYQFNVVLITLRLFHSYEMSKDSTP